MTDVCLEGVKLKALNVRSLCRVWLLALGSEEEPCDEAAAGLLMIIWVLMRLKIQSLFSSSKSSSCSSSFRRRGR